MTLRIADLAIAASEQNPELSLRLEVARYLAIPEQEVLGIRIVKKSLDARKKSKIVYHFRVDVDVEDQGAVIRQSLPGIEEAPQNHDLDPLEGIHLPSRPLPYAPIIIGSGPAGTFAALTLARAGQPVILLERGEPVEQRLRTVGRLRRHGNFEAESNYCFGEGGAGTFSDGKLSCGRNHPLVRYLFKQWVDDGAPEEILYDAHPHIGTDYLLKIAKRQRQRIEQQGGQFHFKAKVSDITMNADARPDHPRFQLSLEDGRRFESNHVILAVGHSARDTYQMLWERGLAIQAKPFAIGARLEHPQDLINKIQFGSCPFLGAAEYKLVSHQNERGIWTFCMCPGGHLLPTGAHAGHLAINGMSYHARNSGYANAAVVVNVLRQDYDRGHPLDGMHWQAAIEQKAFAQGGGGYHAPGQRLKDFLAGRQSKGELTSTYRPGVESARLDQILPDFVATALKSALQDYDKRMRGFVSDQAMVIGTETKTSAPIVMLRDKTLQSTSHPGIFPCGEGAGYAGGIVSAALDGVRVGRALLASLDKG